MNKLHNIFIVPSKKVISGTKNPVTYYRSKKKFALHAQNKIKKI